MLGIGIGIGNFEAYVSVQYIGKFLYRAPLLLKAVTIICDWACDNRACGHMIFAYFFTLLSLITFCTIMLWQF